MSILDRISKVVKSNVNSLLSSAEDPEKTINQAILDMEESLRDGKKELISILAEEKLAAKKVDQAAEEAADWEKKAELALRSGDEGLARQALERKQSSLAEHARLEAQVKQHRMYIEEMRMNLDEGEKKLEYYKMHKGTLIARAKGAASGGDTPSGLGNTEAFANFERQASSIERLDAELQAQREVDEVLGGKDAKDAEVDAKFRELERSADNPSLDDELAALKAKLGK